MVHLTIPTCHSVLILSVLIIDCLRGDHWSPSPGSTVLILSEAITSQAIVNPPRINNVDPLRGDRLSGNCRFPPRRFTDFYQKYVSTSACLALQRTFPIGKSKKRLITFVMIDSKLFYTEPCLRTAPGYFKCTIPVSVDNQICVISVRTKAGDRVSWLLTKKSQSTC